MRLAAKLALAMCVVVAAGLIVQAIVHYEQVRTLHAVEARDDVRASVRAVQGAVEDIWQRSGREAAAGYVNRLSGALDGTRVRLLPDARPEPGAFSVATESQEVAAIAPVMVGHEVVAGIELRRDRHTEREYLRQHALTQLATTLAILVLLGLLSLGVGYLLVARPTEHLIEQMRRIGEGDYAPSPEIGQRDEIGKLARAINDMAARLARARKLVGEQRRGRAAMLEQLRHADRLATVGKLASGLAHELGTPLNVVAGRASMIAAHEGADEDVQRDAGIIAERAEHMTGIIQQLLSFARRGLVKEKTPVRELLERAATLVEPLAEERDIAVEVACADEEVAAEIDAGRALQVLTNLMVNGLQSMQDGGRLTVDAAVEQVERPPDPHSAPGRYVALSVQDEGAGIPEDALEHVFEPFFTTKSAGEGTGLGLSVCHGLVREHGGWIDVQSKPGEGSRFTVYLPQGEVA